ncbi:hypothetical protein FSP39_025229, partial [Pinctada imbricata]
VFLFSWSRERAIDFMLNYTAYSRSDHTNEIDRYLTWPGQACAYKIGELKIKELRAKAEKELGKRFDIKDFHLVVLKNGAMPLRLLEKLVDQWIDSVKKSPNYGSYKEDDLLNSTPSYKQTALKTFFDKATVLLQEDKRAMYRFIQKMHNILLYQTVLLLVVNGDQVEDLDNLQKDFSEWRLGRAPEFATSIGVNRYNDIVENFNWQRFSTDKEKTEFFLRELQHIDYNSLDDENKAGYDIFNDTLHTFLQGYKWKDYNAMNPVNFLEGRPHYDPESFTDQAPFYTYGDYINFISRIKRMPQQVKDLIGRMNRSIELHHTYYNTSVLDVPSQIEEILTDRAEDFPFYKPFTEKLENNTNIEDSLKTTLRNEAKTAIQNVLSEFRALKTYMSQVYLRNTRSHPSVNSWDKGEEYYRDCLRWHLSLDMSPEEVHQKGLEEVSRISGKMNTIMKRLNHHGSVKEFFDNVRSDSRFFLNTSEQVLNLYKDIVYRQIEPKLPQLFKDLPNLPVIVAPTSTDGTGGLYIAGPADGSRPGIFYLNLFRPKKMATVGFMALSLHETSPGHHLQFSVASVSKLPGYRSFFDSYYFNPPSDFPTYTAFVEGWALYSEALGEEMDLYKDDYELMGRYGSEIFRACRLVVDTGLHHYNWSRQHAIQYMLNYTASNEEQITIEIDRYLTWPGQACAYKIGELKIRELRTKAETNLGENFDIKDFHSVVLKNGALPLNILERVVNQWIQSVKESIAKTPAKTKTCLGTSVASYTRINLTEFFFAIILLFFRQ